MIKSLCITTVFIFFIFTGSAQQFVLETDLDTAVNETSGLLYLNNTLITHNDSGTTNQLFEIDIATGSVTRIVTITNATNTDWEDLTYDDTYIYIGDFGNYQGNRTDLKVYRIAISDYLSNTSVVADVINFSYSNQTDYTPSPLATNFDAEGLIHYNNMLYVFSKNWLDGKTNIYQLSKIPGTHSISIIDTVQSQGLVSGATYNAIDNSIMICGYDINGAFLIQLNAFDSGLFSNGNVIKTSVSVPTNYSPQIEGVFPVSATEYYVTSEENSPSASGLYSINTATLAIQAFNDNSISFYPNPAQCSITLNHDHYETQIYNFTGQLVNSSSQKEIDISNLIDGIYLVKIEDKNSGNSTIKRLIVKE